jgi:cytochrome c5
VSAAQDRKFRDLFSLVIGILAGVAIGIFFLAVQVANRAHPEARRLAEPEYRRQVAERIAPPVRIALAGRDNSALAIAPSAPASQPALAIPTSGEEVFQQVCAACHGAGIGGAPRAGDAAAWTPRIAKGKSTLYQHAIDGFKGETGQMPPKGGRTDIPDELVRSAVDQMTGMIR